MPSASRHSRESVGIWSSRGWAAGSLCPSFERRRRRFGCVRGLWAEWTPPSTFPLLAQALRCCVWGCQVCLRLLSPCSLDESCDRGHSAEERRWGWPWRATCGSRRRALGCSPISWSVLGYFLIAKCPGFQNSLKPPGYFIKMEILASPAQLLGTGVQESAF